MSIPDDLKEIYSQCTEFLAHPGEPSTKPIEWCVQLIERIGRVEAVNQRLTDLVRYQRSELHAAGLIDNEEYAALVADSENGQRVARLEGYDKIKAENAALRAQVERKCSCGASLPSECTDCTRLWQS